MKKASYVTELQCPSRKDIYYYQHRSSVIIIGNLNGFPVSWPKRRHDSCANAVRLSDC